MKYKIDWIQFASLIIAFAAYAGVIWMMFAYWAPWPITFPLTTIAAVASGTWYYHYSLHEEKNNEAR